MRAAAGVLTLIGCLAGGLATSSAADPESWVNPPRKPPSGSGTSAILKRHLLRKPPAPTKSTIA
jgi:hypothetical protein